MIKTKSFTCGYCIHILFCSGTSYHKKPFYYCDLDGDIIENDIEACEHFNYQR